jgi:hypothetical protein
MRMGILESGNAFALNNCSKNAQNVWLTQSKKMYWLSTAVVFNLGYTYPGRTPAHPRGYAKTSHGVCKFKKYILFRYKH